MELSVNGCLHGFDNTLHKENNLAAENLQKICSKENCRKSAVLQCLPFAESHTVENLLLALESPFSEYKIRERLHLVVRDNAANIVKAVNDGGLKHVGCFLHGLHLVVTNSLKKQKSVATLLTKIRSIVRKLRHSTKAKSVLMKAQEREGISRHTLIIDQETRWSSCVHH